MQGQQGPCVRELIMYDQGSMAAACITLAVIHQKAWPTVASFSSTAPDRHAPVTRTSPAGTHLRGRVAVGGVVLGNDADDEAAPQAGDHADADVPVLDDAVRVRREDAGELCRQSRHRQQIRHLRASRAAA